MTPTKDPHRMYVSSSSRSVFCLLLFASLAIAACDSGGSSGDVNNQFDFSIQSASTSNAEVAKLESARKQVSGFSFFFDAEHPETGEKAFGIYLSDSEAFSADGATQGLFGFLARLSARPGPGTYSFTSGSSGVQSSQFVGLLYENFSNIQNAPFYVVESGTLTVETSTETEVSGRVDATGTSYSFVNGSVEQEAVEISGTFSAKSVETFVAFNTPGV